MTTLVHIQLPIDFSTGLYLITLTDGTPEWIQCLFARTRCDESQFAISKPCFLPQHFVESIRLGMLRAVWEGTQALRHSGTQVLASGMSSQRFLVFLLTFFDGFPDFFGTVFGFFSQVSNHFK